MPMTVRRLLAAALLMVAALCPPASSAAATGSSSETWDGYARMFAQSAGQYWSQSAVDGQWAWDPKSATESHISWGHPSAWPPPYVERFIRDGDWVRLDGWWDNGTYYTLRTAAEWTADADCKTNRTALAAGGSQRYVRWTVPTTTYCLFAVGTVTEGSSGKIVAFAHEQVWSREMCANFHLGTRPCLKQVERWWDDNASRWAEKVSRVQHIGKDVGMAYLITSYQPGTTTVQSSAALRYAWTW